MSVRPELELAHQLYTALREVTEFYNESGEGYVVGIDDMVDLEKVARLLLAAGVSWPPQPPARPPNSAPR